MIPQNQGNFGKGRWFCYLSQLPNKLRFCGDLPVDLFLVALLTGFCFDLTFHPNFFGDELFAPTAASQTKSWLATFKNMNSYKPRLIYNGLLSFLATTGSPRAVYAALVGSLMALINTAVFAFGRINLGVDRFLAWIVILTLLTSRYGVMLYYDYTSGLIEVLATLWLLITLFLTRKAYGRNHFNWSCAFSAVTSASITIFCHERYFIAGLTAGFFVLIAECFYFSKKPRRTVLFWGVSIGVIPLFLFSIANNVCASMPLATGTSGRQVNIGLETVLVFFTYLHNIFGGGNFGPAWLWGTYNHLHPTGVVLATLSTISTIVLSVFVVRWHGFKSKNLFSGLALLGVILGLVAVASLPGLERQEARFMFPVGILIIILWLLYLDRHWRHLAISIVLITNLTYLTLGSQNDIANIYSSRAANAVASALKYINPKGKRGIMVGNYLDDRWTFGTGSIFSELNLKSEYLVAPVSVETTFNPKDYNFGLVFSKFGPQRTPSYQLTSIESALVVSGIWNAERLVTETLLGDSSNWGLWNWSSPPKISNGFLYLLPDSEGWIVKNAPQLDGRLLVFNARTEKTGSAPLRLQINWHETKGNSLIKSDISVVYPSQNWQPYTMLLNAPPGAQTGVIYAKLHDSANGIVQIKTIELKQTP